MLDFRDCRVVLKDGQSGTVLCDTQVVEYNRNQNQIFLYGISYDKLQKLVSVTLYHPTGLQEFRGKVRKRSDIDLIEVSLFQVRTQKKRKNKRYSVNTPMVINDLSQQGARNETTVNVQNISVSGILVHTEKDILAIGDTFCVHLPLGDEQITVETQVVRLHGETDNGFEYGCSFKSIKK